MTQQFRDEKHRDKIIDRIRKLIAVANGTCYDGEADTAMRMAKGLMSSYGLHMSEVELKENVHANLGKDTVNRVGRLHTWEKLVGGCCAELCDTRVVIYPVGDLYTLMYVGMKQDVELSVILFEDFCARMKSLAVAKYDTLYDRYRYLEGIAARLVDRANEISDAAKAQTPSYGALVVVKENEIEAFMQEELGSVKKAPIDVKASAAFNQGYKDGEHFDLNTNRRLE